MDLSTKHLNIFFFNGQSSVEDPRCLSRIPDPDFYPSRIPDLGSRIPDPRTATKERGEKKFVVTTFIVATDSQNCKLF
jgi:hypothetical protein